MLRNVLHVDDDEDIRAIACVALETIGGLNIVQCASGAEALERLNTFTPDLILLDSMMPGMNGEQTLLEVRKRADGKNVPIVFVTAKVHEEARRNFVHLGAAAIVVKPFEPLTLADQLRTIWQQCQYGG